MTTSGLRLQSGQARKKVLGFVCACLTLLLPEAALGRADGPRRTLPGPQHYWGPGFGYGYGYSYGYGYEPWIVEPVPVIYPAGPPVLVVNNTYYELGVRGMRRLCDENMSLCAQPHLDEALHHLETRRIAGITLAWTGLATAIVGPVVSTVVNCSGGDGYCRPDNGVVLGTVLGGLATTVTGLILLPGNHDVMRLVNQINQTHPEHPVGLKLSLVHGQGAAIQWAKRF